MSSPVTNPTPTHEPIVWTQGATYTVTTRLRDIGVAGGLSLYQTAGRTDTLPRYEYFTADEAKARRAHRVIARRLARLEEPA